MATINILMFSAQCRGDEVKQRNGNGRTRWKKNAGNSFVALVVSVSVEGYEMLASVG